MASTQVLALPDNSHPEVCSVQQMLYLPDRTAKLSLSLTQGSSQVLSFTAAT